MSTETKPTHAELLKRHEEAKKNLLEARRILHETSVALQKRKRKKKDMQRKSSEMADYKLIENSNVWHKLYLESEAQFMAFDATLTTPAIWLAKIKAFEDHPNDETIMDDLADKTQTLDEQIAAVLKLADSLEYFVSRAFPNQERKMQEFGFDNLRKQCPNYVGYLALNVLTMILVAADFIPELTAVGMPSALLTQLDDGVGLLGRAEAEQEYVKRFRIRMTTQRIKMFNELWDIHIMIHKAAKIIFSDNEEMARTFE